MGAPGTGWQARWMRGQGASRRLGQEGQASQGGAVRRGALCEWCVCQRDARAHEWLGHRALRSSVRMWVVSQCAHICVWGCFHPTARSTHAHQ